MFRNLGDAFGLGRAYVEIGRLNFDRGDYQQARKMFEQALATDRQLRYQYGVTAVLLDLGDLCRVQGDYDQAEVLFEESLSNWREYDFGDDNISPFYLGCIMLYRGHYGEARARYIEYMKLSQRHDLPVNIGEGLIGLAAAMAGLHQYERATLLAGAGQAIFDAVVYKVPFSDRIEIDPLLQIAREQLGEARFQVLAAEGRAMTMEHAVAYALELRDA